MPQEDHLDSAFPAPNRGVLQISEVDVVLRSDFVPENNWLISADGIYRSFDEYRGEFTGQRVGIFQGTFDPPTILHFNLISAALQHCDLLLVYPTNRNSRKRPEPLFHRVTMLRMGIEAAAASRVLVAHCCNQPPFPAFIAGCSETFGALCLIVQGADKLLDLPWYSNKNHPSRAIADLPHVIFLNSSEVLNADTLIQTLGGSVTTITHEWVMHSSKARELLAGGDLGSARALLHHPIFNYIMECGLYGTAGT